MDRHAPAAAPRRRVTSRGPLVITGGTGRLALTVAPALADRGWEVFALGRAALDVTDPTAVEDCIAASGATVVLNLAAWTDVLGCEREPDRAERINAAAVAHLRDSCRRHDAHLVHISSDLVFDGRSDTPYVEDDAAHPVNVYGVTKLHSEQVAGHSATVLRTSWISGRHGRCLVRTAFDAALDPEAAPHFVADQFGSPTVADDLVDVLDHVAMHRVAGLYHVAGEGVASPHTLARHVFAECGADPDRVVPVATADRATAHSTRRPAYAVLDSSRLRSSGTRMPGDWRDAVSQLVARISGPTPSGRTRSYGDVTR